jgi:hypothetical protein
MTISRHSCKQSERRRIAPAAKAVSSAKFLPSMRGEREKQAGTGDPPAALCILHYFWPEKPKQT